MNATNRPSALTTAPFDSPIDSLPRGATLTNTVSPGKAFAATPQTAHANTPNPRSPITKREANDEPVGALFIFLSLCPVLD